MESEMLPIDQVFRTVQLPTRLTQSVADGPISNADLRALLHKHITDEVRHFRGEIRQWDVANEFFTGSNPSGSNPNDFWISHLRAGVIAEAIQWAHAADPHALLFYNDTTPPVRTARMPKATPRMHGSSRCSPTAFP
jgi:GH35 family endo-1,4-beta-xylanase